MSDELKLLISYLCMTCPRANTVCKEYPPTYEEAYRCKWDEAQILSKKIDERIKFLEATND